jgi:hypothetical protein
VFNDDTINTLQQVKLCSTVTLSRLAADFELNYVGRRRMDPEVECGDDQLENPKRSVDEPDDVFEDQQSIKMIALAFTELFLPIKTRDLAQVYHASTSENAGAGCQCALWLCCASDVSTC